MSINYNFAFKNSKLKRWEKPSTNNILVSEASLKSKIIYLYKVFTKNPELFYPPSFILIAAIVTQIINIYPTNIVNRLESQHKEYTTTSQKLSNLESKINTMGKHLGNMKVFYSQATPTYLFAFYLQNSIPQGVQLSDYSISDNGFEITASSYGIEPLNQMVTLLIESPIISKSSVSIKKISRKDNNVNSNSGIKSNVTLEIHGNILKLSLEKRKRLYTESYAEGLSKKLIRFNTLNRLIRS